jgi:hypothetical protein
MDMVWLLFRPEIRGGSAMGWRGRGAAWREIYAQ